MQNCQISNWRGKHSNAVFPVISRNEMVYAYQYLFFLALWRAKILDQWLTMLHFFALLQLMAERRNTYPGNLWKIYLPLLIDFRTLQFHLWRGFPLLSTPTITKTTLDCIAEVVCGRCSCHMSHLILYYRFKDDIVHVCSWWSGQKLFLWFHRSFKYKHSFYYEMGLSSAAAWCTGIATTPKNASIIPLLWNSLLVSKQLYPTITLQWKSWEPLEFLCPFP